MDGESPNAADKIQIVHSIGKQVKEGKESTTDEKETKLCEFCQETIAAKATRCRYCGSMLSKKSTEENATFSVVREEIQEQGMNGVIEKYTKVTIVVKDEQVKQNLKMYMNNNPKLFDKEPKINADELFTILPQLRQNNLSYMHNPSLNPLGPLVEFLEKEYEEQSKKFEEMKKDGVITFEALQFIFTRGTKFFGFFDGSAVKIGSEVVETNYTRTMFATFFVITGEVIKSNGEKFFSHNHMFVIPQFRGVKKIQELSVQPLDPDTEKHLTERGKKFNQIATGAHYVNYTGNMTYRTPYYVTASGRIIIDGTSFNKMNPNYREFVQNPQMVGRQMWNFSHTTSDEQNITEIPPEAWFKTWPTVGGFSFASKKWGEIHIEYTSDIVYDDNAFNRLVLPEEKKSLIKALVLNTEHSFADIITGKGAGCIFLLHGPPGCGKTLTAEAIAEMLHRPLYSVSVGELGTQTDTLETKLRDILDVASVWNSVILIDEADIFLERRTDSDIKRNAMVGIFLRLLEYHQGILFLTTNRVKRFDPAFHSRISIALKYDVLQSVAREKVWENFFEVAGINGLDAKELAKYELNGRQIRNTIRLAQALAKNEKTALSMSHVERTISVASQFKEDVAIGDDESGAGVDSKVLVATAVLPVVSLSALCAVAYFIKRKFF